MLFRSRANIGLYYVRNWKLLYEGIQHVLAQPANKGEFYLTDAFQYMIDHGAKLRVIDVAGWYDAGKLDTLLETNRVMLEQGRAESPALPGVTVIPPVRIEVGATVTDSTIGPNVVIPAGTTVAGSTLRDTILGSGTRVSGCTLHDSMIGDACVVEGVTGAVLLGDHSEVRQPV